MNNAEDIFLSSAYLQSHKLPSSQSFFDTSRTLNSLKEVSTNSALLFTADGGIYSATFLVNSLSYLILKGIQDSLAAYVTSFDEYHPALKTPKVREKKM
jgi:hypothetical protein